MCGTKGSWADAPRPCPAQGFSKETGQVPSTRGVNGEPAACRHFGWKPRPALALAEGLCGQPAGGQEPGSLAQQPA